MLQSLICNSFQHTINNCWQTRAIAKLLASTLHQHHHPHFRWYGMNEHSKRFQLIVVLIWMGEGALWGIQLPRTKHPLKAFQWLLMATLKRRSLQFAATTASGRRLSFWLRFIPSAVHLFTKCRLTLHLFALATSNTGKSLHKAQLWSVSTATMGGLWADERMLAIDLG